MPEYRIFAGSVHEKFLASRAEIQIFGGGFGNGKTTTVCVKAIQLLQDYPGSNGLIARSTFPKLNDTIRKEFKKWCPPKLIDSFPQSKNSDNTAKFTNGSVINFRYIAQQGKNTEQSTSNLLSATYDWIIIDQIEDPEISEKDFWDLLGRLRGNTVYRGTDPTMPKVGPQFLMLTCNPTANWFYKKVVRPLKIYQDTGRITDELLCYRGENRRPILDEDGKPKMMVELFEGPTTINSHNLTSGFIMRMQSAYRGQMYDRFVKGEWASYEGLVYPDYNATLHTVTPREVDQYINREAALTRYTPRWVEGYDFGIQSPSCYLLGYVDASGIVIIVDGFHRPEMPVKEQSREIRRIRSRWGVPEQLVYGDPSMFRRTSVRTGTVGASTTDMFFNEGGPTFRRGNNDIENGILKIGSYLPVQEFVRNPFTGEPGSPLLFVSDHLDFWHDEITAYMWQKKNDGTETDKPVDKNDHAMDATRYLFSDLPEPVALEEKANTVPVWMQWNEIDRIEDTKGHRYG